MGLDEKIQKFIKGLLTHGYGTRRWDTKTALSSDYIKSVTEFLLTDI